MEHVLLLLKINLSSFLLYDDHCMIMYVIIIIWQDWQTRISYLITMSPHLLENITRVGSFLLHDDVMIWLSYDSHHIADQNIIVVCHIVDIIGDVIADTGQNRQTTNEQGKIGLLSLWMLDGWILQNDYSYLIFIFKLIQ